MTVALELWKELLGQIGCVCCTRGWAGAEGPVEQHHVAKGSGKRHEYSRTVLCRGHHTGGAGFHRMGKAFLRLYRPPGDDEYGLVIWAIEDVMKLLHQRKKSPATP